jgi:hypothetical protein
MIFVLFMAVKCLTKVFLFSLQNLYERENEQFFKRKSFSALTRRRRWKFKEEKKGRETKFTNH